ncbi:beta-ketoacyl synthase N-terminal-like domain-containing protein, partial [Paenibacillus graminis]|uniref:beta-ketoacyl synthase N-terminal-like domain-containing protein n=3 Tax=Paenibacillus graminis TaxID=189425 RepID=UPI002DB8B6B4
MEKKDEIYSYILQEVGSGHLDKSIAAHLIHYLRQDHGKEADTDIAVIGVASRFSNTGSTSEVEKLLTLGVDCIQELPASRKEQAGLFLPLFQVEKNRAQYDKAGYLSEIDPFDYAFFNISPREASLMDPNQRLFLQLAWEAIEESGYGGAQLTGSRTGVFIGYSSDFGEEYKKGIQMLMPEAMGVAIPGNIKSVIASRISHYLDLKGPAVVLDTACSSSLVAIHFACKQLIEGSCDLALAGGIKLQLFPLKSHAHLKIGIESSDEKTKTFDDSSNGTGKGEGAGAVLLKPLKKALQDRDHIHAIIKGSAINQDGNSIGITAPDSQAQEEVLCRAWEEAGINPEELSYIEAHGTGTRLGDPIEIEGINRAFSRYTKKKQFCAIGSLKTNIGHLDHAAGIAGLVKVIYSLKSKKLFPSLHFMKPNQTINFSESAVYVNDQLQEWTASGAPRLAGISSFGLSGTNCHMVLEEAPPAQQKQHHGETVYLLPLSAKDEGTLREMAAEYINYLYGECQIDLEDLCYTASTGRGHYNHRLAVIFTGYKDLLNQLEHIEQHRLASLTEREKQALAFQAAQHLKEMARHPEKVVDSYRRIADLYISGAAIDWEEMYKGRACNRLSLPVYPFLKTRCWIKPEAQVEPKRSTSGREVHPLLADVAGETPDQATYAVRMSAEEAWVLNEHKVGSEYVLPGTAYIELLLEIGRQQGGRSVIKQLAFLQPFSVQEGETQALQITLKKGSGDSQFTIESKDQTDGTWRRHAEGKLCHPSRERKTYDLPALLEAFHTHPKITGVETSGGYITTGARWNNIKELRVGAEECLVHVGLSDAYREEAAGYHYHPAMLDNTVNIAIRSIDDQLYLPFYYQEIRVYGRIPADIYSVVRRKDSGQGHQTATFDIDILNPAGEVLAEIEGYTIKQVQAWKSAGMYYAKDWMVQDGTAFPDVDRGISRETVAVFTGEGEIADRLLEQIRSQYGQVIEISGGEWHSREDYQLWLERLQAGKVGTVIHLAGLSEREIETKADLDEAGERGFYSLYSLLDGLFVQHSSGDLKLILVCDEANQVTGEEAGLRPHHGCLLGLGKVAREEFPQVHIRLVDVDRLTPPDRIVNEFSLREAPYQVAYRNGQRYVERLKEAPLEPDEGHPGLQEGGVYVITGGTGGLGLEIGKQMSRMSRVKLHLIGRRELPAREHWAEIVAAGAGEQQIRQIAAIQEMERNGAEVQLHAADVAEEGPMRSVLERIRA